MFLVSVQSKWRLGTVLILNWLAAAKVMGIGPAFAIPKALEKAGITQDEVDFFEM